eukprot:s3698_g1.t1
MAPLRAGCWLLTSAVPCIYSGGTKACRLYACNLKGALRDAPGMLKNDCIGPSYRPSLYLRGSEEGYAALLVKSSVGVKFRALEGF